MKNIAEKFDSRAKKINSLLCVGLDADIKKIPDRFLSQKFPQFEFNKYIIEETHEYTSAYKPNSAFYEARGDQGIRELKMTFDYLREKHPSIFTILDAKRGDIGNTNNGYVEFAYDWLGADAITLYPYLGQEAVEPFLSREDRVAIFLCRTSNAGAKDFQDIEIEEKKLWEIVAEKISGEWNEKNNCMLVVGATYPEEMKRIREITRNMTFLVPGIGAQGGNLEEVMRNGLNNENLGLIINSSRGIIFSKNPKEEARKLYEEIRRFL